jgi:ribosomal protein S18 acetylase RimI-like enzyme
VINLVVDPEHRRSGVGSTMLRYLKDIVAEKVKFVIRESNTSAHYFMKANSFKALKVRRSYFMDQHSMDGPEEYEDGYVFAYSHVISNMDEPIVAWSEV